MSLERYTGSLTRGRGIGKGVMKSLTPKLKAKNFEFFPGTLNLLLSKPAPINLDLAEFEIDLTWFFFPGTINGYPCYFLCHPKCPDHIIEVIADNNLTDIFSLHIGSSVNIEIDSKYLNKGNLWRKFYWYLIWKGREKLYYENYWYQWFMGKFIDLKFKLNYWLSKVYRKVHI